MHYQKMRDLKMMDKIAENSGILEFLGLENDGQSRDRISGSGK